MIRLPVAMILVYCGRIEGRKRKREGSHLDSFLNHKSLKVLLIIALMERSSLSALLTNSAYTSVSNVIDFFSLFVCFTT